MAVKHLLSYITVNSEVKVYSAVLQETQTASIYPLFPSTKSSYAEMAKGVVSAMVKCDPVYLSTHPDVFSSQF